MSTMSFTKLKYEVRRSLLANTIKLQCVFFNVTLCREVCGHISSPTSSCLFIVRFWPILSAWGSLAILRQDNMEFDGGPHALRD
jgi:hypothetical protein